jgi:hypothetical protein
MDVQRAIKAAHAAYTDEQWEVMAPRVRTKLIYDELRRIDAVRDDSDSDHGSTARCPGGDDAPEGDQIPRGSRNDGNAHADSVSDPSVPSV